MQLVFCFFADDVGLLPQGFCRKVLRGLQRASHEQAKALLDDLFAAMATGGDFNLMTSPISTAACSMASWRCRSTKATLAFCCGRLDWGVIDPTIFGTLFERFLDPDKRAQIGAHYTDAEKILKIVDPVVMRPLGREWEDRGRGDHGAESKSLPRARRRTGAKAIQEWRVGR